MSAAKSKKAKKRAARIKNRHPFIIALGGSVVAPDGVDLDFLQKFRVFLKKFVRQGFRFIIIIGGGGLARSYQRNAAHLSRGAKTIELDTIGMRATQLNAELMRVILGNKVYPEIINTPEKLLHMREPIAIAAGWMPGYSTDTVAVRVAEEIGAKQVIIAGKPAFVYDRDFMKEPGAKPFKHLTWPHYRKLIAKRWQPGMSAPVDPVAAERAQRMGLEVIVVRGTHLENLTKVFKNEKFRGTIIT